MRRILIIGADSMIGKYLDSYLSSFGNFIILKTSRRKKSSNFIYLDMNKPEDFEVPNNLDFVIFLNYAGGISFARENKNFSNKTNVTNTIKILKMLQNKNIHLIYPSTNLITSGFDGTKHEYIMQKLKIENEIKNLFKKSIVIRGSKIIYPDFYLFNFWIDCFKTKKKIYPYEDLFFSPIWIADYLKLIKRLIDVKYVGKILYTSNGEISYSKAALKIANFFHLDSSKLIFPSSRIGKIHSEDVIPNNYLCLKDTRDISFFTDIISTPEKVIDTFMKEKIK